MMADAIAGEPPIRPHPVAVLGRGLQFVEDAVYQDRVANGVVHAGAGLAAGVAAGAALRSTAVATYLASSGRALRAAATDVDRALATDDLEGARTLVPGLVGRDPTALDEKDICRAVIESVAENTVDAIVAPALWALGAGAPGAIAHRAVNTMDSMIGHRDDRYAAYGKAAARLDDAAAWVPARVTAALVVCCRPRVADRVVRTVRRDAASHPSPNAGVAEAAFAAALDLRLGGENRYGDRVELRALLGSGRPPERRDIRRATRLSRDVTFALAGLLTVAGFVQSVRR
jgi:adenosylcobinamide-phosphate synthase